MIAGSKRKMEIREGQEREWQAMAPKEDFTFTGTEGCSCVADAPRLAHVIEVQSTRIRELHEGTRIFVDWPTHLGDKTIWEYGAERNAHAIAAAERAIERITHARAIAYKPACTQKCKGTGVCTERTHILRCSVCEHEWQSSWWWAYIKSNTVYLIMHITEKTDARRRRRADFLRRYEQGIEPHPGPRKTPKHNTYQSLRCPNGHTGTITTLSTSDPRTHR